MAKIISAAEAAAKIKDGMTVMVGGFLGCGTPQNLVDQVLALSTQEETREQRYMLLAPVIRERKGEHAQVFDQLRAQGYVRVRVDGQLVFNTTQPQVEAALAGLGIALLPEDEVMPHVEAGRLVRVLQDWCPPFAGYHLYYPSRRQPSPAFARVVEALRY